MKREEGLQRISEGRLWDILVVGGGSAGLGVALEAATRGYQTLLVEQDDFCKGTSSRSTKLIHGGVRYLARGDVSLVRAALRERGLLIRNAPHLVHPLPFVLPLYRWWEVPYYTVGLKFYDLLAGDWSLGKSRWLSRAEVVRRLPTLRREGLVGGVLYFDAQFDDARLGVCLAQTLTDHDGFPVNYLRVVELLKAGGRVSGVVVEDLEREERCQIRARAVVNATGVFADQIRGMDQPGEEPLVVPSQGIHVVLDGGFLPGDHAMIIPRTEDGRVLFAIPWQQRVLVGTTDTPVESIQLEPRSLPEEIEFLRRHCERYFRCALSPENTLSPENILSTFAGLRPLVREKRAQSTASLSRDHTLLVSPAGLVTITGGKWTTYRKMAEETVSRAAEACGLPERPSRTRDLHLHGWTDRVTDDIWRVYGAEAPRLKELLQEQANWAEPLHPGLPYLAVQVVWAVREEMARTLEDVLSRRTRALVLDARAALAAAPKVADLMGSELSWSPPQRERQLARFQAVAEKYLVGRA